MISTFTLNNRFLSNFYTCSIEYNGKKYPTAEHLFQALKTLDKKVRQKIRISNTPGVAKRKGRVLNLRDDWEDIKDEVMYSVLRRKFSNQRMRKKLLNTKDNLLVEGNTWHDNYWGNCHCGKCITYHGKNKLGIFLMKLRFELQVKRDNQKVDIRIKA